MRQLIATMTLRLVKEHVLSETCSGQLHVAYRIISNQNTFHILIGVKNVPDRQHLSTSTKRNGNSNKHL